MAKPVNYEKFLNWAISRFSDVLSTGNLVKINSIFCDHLGGDFKHHLCCKPEIGYFNCFKSGKKDSLVNLVKEVERCSYHEAVKILGGESFNVHRYEDEINKLLSIEESEEVAVAVEGLQFPENTYLISELPDFLRKKPEEYLKSRKLSISDLYYCVSGDYRDRIIIPYWNENKKLMYWNGRSINKDAKLRYRGPRKSEHGKKEESIWFSYYPRRNSVIHVTEGEFDAMSLNACRLFGAAFGGKDVSDRQLALLDGYRIVIAFDADISGKDATVTLGRKLLARQFKDVRYVLPPKGVKDWNDLWKRDGRIMKNIVEATTKIFDDKVTVYNL